MTLEENSALGVGPALTTHPEQPTDSYVNTELNKQLWRGLPTASFTLSLLYLIFAAAHPFTVGGEAGWILAAIAGSSAVILFLYGLWLRRSSGFHLANLATAILAGIVLFNVASHLLTTRDPAQSSNFVLLVVAIGAFFFSSRWCAAAIVAVGAVWGSAFHLLPNDHRTHWIFAFISASLVAVLAFRLRTHALRSSIVDAWKERRHRELLEVAETELLRANKELEVRVADRTAELQDQIEQTRMLEQAALESEKLAATGRMAATLAHEINNPLGALSNLLFLIHGRPDDVAQVLSLSATAQEQVQHLANITRQTLSFHHHSALPRVTEVRDLMAEVIDFYGQVIKERGVVVVLQNRGDTKLECNAGEIRQVFSNLLLNSLEASQPNTRILIRVRQCGKHEPGAVVSFCDQGDGIPAELHQRIFKPFFTTKEDSGTGLGLWVAQGIISRHRGKIRVRSSTKPEKHGTIMSVWLPSLREKPGTPRLRYERLDPAK